MGNKIEEEEESEKNVEEIKYVKIEEEEVELDELERYVELLHRYLNEFISESSLREDVEYCFEKGRAIGAYHEDRLIGAVVGVQTPFFDKFHIAHIAIDEKYQDQGIGTELTERVIPEDKGASVHLNTDNPGIEKFYEKMGFQLTHKRLKKSVKESSEFKPSD